MKDRKHILITDNDRKEQKSLSNILLKFNCIVTTANDGQEALSFLKKRHYDLLITEITLPRMNGIELLEAVKATVPETKVIILTGRGDIETYLESMELGVLEYLNKPLRIGKLKKIIKRFFPDMVISIPKCWNISPSSLPVSVTKGIFFGPNHEIVSPCFIY